MRRTRRNRIGLCLVLAGLAVPAAAALRDPAELRQELQSSEQTRAAALAASQQATAKALAAQQEAARLAAARVAAAAQLQNTETALQQAASHMATLAQQRADLQAQLASRAADLGPLLPVIERLSAYPTETLIAMPEPPEDAIRGALVVRGLARTLEQDARLLRQAQAQLAAADAAVAGAEPALQTARQAQQRQGAELDAQIAAAQATQHAADDDNQAVLRQAALEAAHAADLRGALTEIDAAQRAAQARARAAADRAAKAHKPAAEAAAIRQEAVLSQPAGQGPMPGGVMPVAGRLLRGWGADTPAGPARGLSFEPAPGAHVTAPCGGRVVFAGPFRSYGNLLILDCGHGYHFVLAGLDHLDVELGRPVQSGEPVGVMPNWDPTHPGPRPALYVELRRDGQPIDPEPWLKDRS
jgi:murein hydrolase activator